MLFVFKGHIFAEYNFKYFVIRGNSVDANGALKQYSLIDKPIKLS